MPVDTVWSDSLAILLSDSMESSIDGPHAVISPLAAHLTKLGHEVMRIDESTRGTSSIKPHQEVFVSIGADPKVLAQVETFLSEAGIRFTKHETINDPDHIDISYDLDNVSVWK